MIKAVFNLSERTLEDICDIACEWGHYPSEYLGRAIQNEIKAVELEKSGGKFLIKRHDQIQEVNLSYLKPWPMQGKKFSISFNFNVRTNGRLLRLTDECNSFDSADIIERAIYRQKFYFEKEHQGYEFYIMSKDNRVFKIITPENNPI